MKKIFKSILLFSLILNNLYAQEETAKPEDKNQNLPNSPAIESKEKTDNNTVNQDLSDVQNRIFQLQGKVSDINIYLSSLQVKLNELIDNSKTGNLTSTQEQVKGLQEKVMDTDTRLQDIQNELLKMEQELKNIKSSGENATKPETGNIAIDEKLKELEQRLSDLEKIVKDAIGVKDNNETPVENKENNSTEKEIKNNLSPEIENKEINVSNDSQAIKMQLEGTILFKQGEVSLSTEGKSLLKKIAPMLKKLENKIVMVIGHTDPVPIGTNLKDFYPTNWELSTTRGSMVVRYLINVLGVDPHILMAAGRSFYDPSNNDRDKRAEIWILPKMNAM